MTHNEAIELLLKEYTSSDKKQLTGLFIQTLPIGRIHFGLQVLSKMKTYYVHSYSIYDIPKTGDFYKDERLWIKENPCMAEKSPRSTGSAGYTFPSG